MEARVLSPAAHEALYGKPVVKVVEQTPATLTQLDRIEKMLTELRSVFR